MKYVEEYKDFRMARRYASALNELVKGEWSIMEVCGGQTHSIVKHGVDQILPDKISLVHGPGCPVCVTPVEMIDKALVLAAQDEIIFCSFGDMLRVPGSYEDLLSVKAKGGDVRIVYSPLDALQIARDNPDREVVFFAIGFETTAPVNAMSVYQAAAEKIVNFSVLVSHVLVPPAIKAILSSKQNQVQGFLAAGHVCAVMGYEEYEPIAEEFGVPIVVTGFEPLDLLQGITMCVQQLESGCAKVENQYSRVVCRTGNLAAKETVNRIFQVIDQKWRGIGIIPNSGLALRGDYESFDGAKKFQVAHITVEESSECCAGQVLQGLSKPDVCPAFGETCTPESPLGATMVSSEGACAAYYRYRR